MFVKNTFWFIEPISGSRPLYLVKVYRFWPLAYTLNLLNFSLAYPFGRNVPTEDNVLDAQERTALDKPV
jgi:hypothetical protein